MNNVARIGFVTLLSIAATSPVKPQGASPDPFRISVSLDLVVLPVTVRDRNGGFASDLSEKDFEIQEDGVRQSIRLFRHEDIQVTVGLIVDHSASMHAKLTDVLAAARSFVHLSNPEDQMFVVNFNERVSLGLPPSLPFTSRADRMEMAILQAPLTGETALYDALDLGLERLRAGSREKKVLIVISDGGDNASVRTLPWILNKAAESNALVYTIGIFDPDDPDKNPGVLTRLAKETGGESFFPHQSSEAIAICQEIARDIRHQYTLGYVSANTRTTGHRSVRVIARSAGKNLVVRTRPGYVAGGTTAKQSTQ